MYGEPKGMRKIYQEIMVRKTASCFEWLQGHLDSTELYSVSRDETGLCLSVAVQSLRAKQLLRDLHRAVFPAGFEEPKPWLEENKFWSATYQYLDPDLLAR